MILPKKKQNFFKKVISFYKNSFSLGLNKKILFISIFLYFSAVFFEAIGIFLILPLFSLFLTGKGLDDLIASQEVIQEILNYVEILGINPDKGNVSFLLIIVLLCRQVIIYARSYWNSIVLANLVYNLRKKALGYFLTAQESIFDKESSGKKINDLTTEVNNSATRIISGIDLVGLLIMFLIYLILMFFLSWKLTTFAFFSFIVSMYILKPLWARSGEIGNIITINNRKFVSHLTQRFSNIKLLKICGNYSYEKKISENINSEIKLKQIKAGFLSSLANSCIEPIILITGSLILFVSIDIFDIDIANLGVFSIIMIRGVPLARSFFNSWQKIEANVASILAVKETINSLKVNKELNNGSLKFTKFKSIKFENVSFTYKGKKKQVINSISFKVISGEMIAIVGPSGAGKSTIIDFIPRLIIPSVGNVKINNNNIINYEINSLRSNISYLPQYPQMLEGTLAEHIRYGNENISDQNIKDALVKAGCENLLKKHQYNININIGSNGAMLSGGEKQRIDLARALARKSLILILDEPSANLDSITEEIIKNAIENERKQRNLTVIVIGHRLNWFSRFTKIIVVKEGIIEAIGNHDIVLKKSSWYKKALENNK